MSKKGGAEAIDASTCAGALSVCACFHFRRAARVVTQYYDEALQPVGLRSTQVVILLSVAAADRPSIAQLAREMAMDASTLNRNLRPLVAKDLIDLEDGADGRRKLVAITRKGREVIADAVPYWTKAQEGLIGALGEDMFHSLIGELDEVVSRVRDI